MAQKEIEVILTRQLAGCLSTPAFIIDVAGSVIFYNEAAERILGQKFDEAGEMPASRWTTIFRPTDDAGLTIPPEGLPLMVALEQRRPAHRTLWIQGIDGPKRRIEITALPLMGQADRFLGALAMFWEVSPS
jgi:PAS domain-containing protein